MHNQIKAYQLNLAGEGDPSTIELFRSHTEVVCAADLATINPRNN